MINYEKYKEDMEKLGDKKVAFDKFKNKIVRCVGLACDNCAFYVGYDDCKLGAMKWAAEEYEEPEVDWSKVPVDTEVLVSTNKKYWISRYFAGIINGKTYAFSNSGTSKMTNKVAYWEYMKLAEVE